ncbi:MAG: ACT domain-containing protein, partial [Pirellulaceae bacterium]
AGPLDFSIVGVIATLTGTLAAADISVFAVSTFDTDYLLVKQQDLDATVKSLTIAGHQIVV